MCHLTAPSFGSLSAHSSVKASTGSSYWEWRAVQTRNGTITDKTTFICSFDYFATQQPLDRLVARGKVEP
jgi:hypothetical protein